MKSRPCMSLETMAFLRFQINCKIKQAYQKAILQLSEHEGEVDLVFIQTPFLLLWKLRLVFASDRVGVGVTWWESKIGVVGGVINTTECKRRSHKRGRKKMKPFWFVWLPFQWKPDCRSRKLENQSQCTFRRFVYNWFSSSASAYDSSTQFSLDRKRRSRRTRNQNAVYVKFYASDYDSDSSLVKTSLRKY